MALTVWMNAVYPSQPIKDTVQCATKGLYLARQSLRLQTQSSRTSLLQQTHIHNNYSTHFTTLTRTHTQKHTQINTYTYTHWRASELLSETTQSRFSDVYFIWYLQHNPSVLLCLHLHRLIKHFLLCRIAWLGYLEWINFAAFRLEVQTSTLTKNKNKTCSLLQHSL